MLAEEVGPPLEVLGGRRATRRACAPYAAESHEVSRHIVLSLLLRETTAKVGIAMKLPMAGWNNACLLTVLGM